MWECSCKNNKTSIPVANAASSQRSKQPLQQSNIAAYTADNAKAKPAVNPAGKQRGG